MLSSQAANPDIFYVETVQSYMTQPHFVERRWLARQMLAQMQDPDCRFLLLTAEPGAGKSAFIAWLARQCDDWPRYFIRRDAKDLLNDAGAHSCLLRIGLQLAAHRPELFGSENLQIAVTQQVGKSAGSVTAVDADTLVASPFHRTIIDVAQDIGDNRGTLTGIKVNTLITDTRQISVSDFQFMALIDPANALLRRDPGARIVILIDALDELRYHPTQNNILSWLANCPPLPANVRIVLTSRPETMLDLFRNRQRAWLRELNIRPDSADVQTDLSRYAADFTAQESIASTLAEVNVDPKGFREHSIRKAQGNFLYLATLYRGITQALESRNSPQLQSLLTAEELPTDLHGLFHTFLIRIEDGVAGEEIAVEDKESGKVHYLSKWIYLYRPILGVLAVAQEPLSVEQIASFGGIRATISEIVISLEHLSQFLEVSEHHYRFYHSSFPEFLTAQQTRKAYPRHYIASDEWHQKTINFYRQQSASWQEVSWREVDDYGLLQLPLHLYALHHEPSARTSLYQLICLPYMQEKFRRTQSNHRFVADVELAMQVAEAEEPQNLVQILRGALICATLSTLADHIPAQLLGSLAQLGKTEAAAGYANLRTDPLERCEGYLQIALGVLANDQRQEAREYLVLALEAAQEISSWRSQGLALGRIADAMGQAEDVAGLRRTLVTVQTIVRDAGRDEDPTDGQRIVVLHEPEEALWHVLAALVRAGERGEAMRIATVLPQNLLVKTTSGISSVRAQALSSVARALARMGQGSDAIASANAILEPHLKAETLCNAAQVLFTSGHVDEARSAASSALYHTDRILKDVYREFAEGYQTWTLSIVARALATVGEPQQAQAAAQKALEIVRDAPPEPYDDWDRAEYQRAAGCALVWAGAFDKGLAVIRSIQRSERVWGLAEVAAILVQAGDRERALTLADEVLDELPKAGSFFRGMSLPHLVEVFVKTGELERALSAYQAIPVDKSFTTSRKEALAILVRALAQQEDEARLDAMFETVLVMPSEDEQTAGILVIAPVMAEFGNLEGLYRLLDTAQTLTSVNRAEALGAVGRAFIQVGEDQAVLRMLAANQVLIGADDEATADKTRAVTAIGQALLEVGDVDQARGVAVNALALIQLIRDEKQRAKEIQVLAQLVVQVSNQENLRRLLQSCQEIVDLSLRAETLVAVVRALATAGHVEGLYQILEMARSFPDPYGRATVLSVMAQALVAVGKAQLGQEAADLASEVARDISDPALQANALIAVTETLFGMDAAAQAEDAATRLASVAEGILDPRHRVASLRKAVELLQKLGAGEAARAAAYSAQTAAETLADDHTSESSDYSKAATLVDVIGCLIAVGDVEQAFAVVQRIESGPYKAFALQDVAQALVRTGNAALFGAVLAAADEIESDIYRAETLAKVGFCLRAVGEIQSAHEAVQRAFSVLQDANFDVHVPYLGSYLAMHVEHIVDILVHISNFFTKISEETHATNALDHGLALAIQADDEDALRKLAQALHARGRTEKAVVVFESALNAADRLADPNARCEAISRVAADLATIGKLDDAVATLLKALDNGFSPTAVSRAVQIISKINTPSIADQVLSVTTRHALRMGNRQVWQLVGALAPLIIRNYGAHTLVDAVEALHGVDSWWRPAAVTPEGTRT